ncbi:MAG: DNA polymerase III subunit beta [Leptospiraceae bacterium]|nr:DNA polymerase III subunit beta [Leptospiraceae bacterium]MCK6379941.1 DNA polymerase III subunit beta [Leptospiraceae bacterium]NUM41464.1 DNA polymerase III subunit beta [Leptospiraceae bacterium]
MKFKVKTNDLLKSIKAVDGVISSREIKSILSNIKIDAHKDKIYLSSTDLEISIKTSCVAEIIEEGSTSLPAKKLNDIIRYINFENSLLEDDSESNAIKITDADKKNIYSTKINSFEGEDTKTFSSVDKKQTINFPCFTFREMIRKTSYSVAQEDSRFVFNGLFLTSKGKRVSFIGTDGRRLAKIDRSLPEEIPFEKGAIIPHKAVKEILKMIDTSEIGKIGFFENQVYIAIGETELLCKTIDGKFPDYEQVIPKNTTHLVKINKDKFQIALQQAIVAAEEPTRQIKMEFNNNILMMFSSSSGTTDSDVGLNIEYNGEKVTIGFKGDYLTDVVRALDDTEFIIEFSNPNSPVIFRDPSDEEFIAIIMPMKL